MNASTIVVSSHVLIKIKLTGHSQDPQPYLSGQYTGGVSNMNPRRFPFARTGPLDQSFRKRNAPIWTAVYTSRKCSVMLSTWNMNKKCNVWDMVSKLCGLGPSSVENVYMPLFCLLENYVHFSQNVHFEKLEESRPFRRISLSNWHTPSIRIDRCGQPVLTNGISVCFGFALLVTVISQSLRSKTVQNQS